MTRNKNTGGNTRLAQWGLTSLIESLCFYCKFVLADSLVFQNPPLRQAWERYRAVEPKLRRQIQFENKQLFPPNVFKAEA